MRAQCHHVGLRNEPAAVAAAAAMDDATTEVEGLDAELLLRQSALWLLDDPDRERFLRRIAEAGPGLFPQALTDDADAVRRAPMHKVLRAEAPQFFRGLGWMIASSMPLPAHDWQLQRVPLPGRNEPCLCGSLRKFKHCCARLFEGAPRLDPVWLGALVLQQMPMRDWAGLPHTRVPLASVLAAADDLRESGRARDAMKLLEPWSRLPAPWPATRAELLDLLADLYLDLDHPRKRKALADAMVERGDPVVQSLGWQRRSMMAADAGDAAAARDAFERAQRLTPDDPRVALLEVTTLLGAGELDRAHERADFHARRLARLPNAAELQPEIDGLLAVARGELDHVGQDVAGGDGDADADAESMPFDVIGELAAWVRAQPAPRLRLELTQASADDLGELAPSRSLRPALAAWHGSLEPSSPGRALRLLRRHPELLDSFDVLYEVLGVVEGLSPALSQGLQLVLLQRAVDLWALLRQGWPAARCEWGWHGNRPALRLLGEWIRRDGTPTAERSFGQLRALVEVLNPNDNQGLRERLAAVLLRRGDAAAALALAERYPDDFVGMRLLHARALLALQRLPEAQAVLAEAMRDNAHVLAMLRRARPPGTRDLVAFGIGTVEEARLAVANQHDLWRDKALQAWLKAQQPAAGGGDGSLQLTLT